MNIVYAPDKNEFSGTKVFLAGTIDMGNSEDWQDKLAKDFKSFDVTFLNPRRPDWDSSWRQTIKDKQFSEQVNWELDNLLSSEIVIFVMLGSSQSPITLMELGYMLGRHKKILVCCEKGFWRRGNVEIICDREKVDLYENIDDLALELKKYLRSK